MLRVREESMAQVRLEQDRGSKIITLPVSSGGPYWNSADNYVMTS